MPYLLLRLVIHLVSQLFGDIRLSIRLADIAFSQISLHVRSRPRGILSSHAEEARQSLMASLKSRGCSGRMGETLENVSLGGARSEVRRSPSYTVVKNSTKRVSRKVRVDWEVKKQKVGIRHPLIHNLLCSPRLFRSTRVTGILEVSEYRICMHVYAAANQLRTSYRGQSMGKPTGLPPLTCRSNRPMSLF